MDATAQRGDKNRDGNCDAHAKNIALILEPAPRLAPFYDLVPTVAFAGLDRRLAMHVGGERLWDRIGGPQWRRLAAQIQVAEKRVVGEVSALTESIPPALDSAGFSTNDLGRLADAIRKRCAHVKDRAGRG